MIALAADHAGYPLKEEIKKHLLERGFDVKDFGTDSDKSVDYAVFAKIAGEAVASGECRLGIFCCGTGVGISMAANKVRGIRAANCADTFSARMTRLHQRRGETSEKNRSGHGDRGRKVLEIKQSKFLNFIISEGVQNMANITITNHPLIQHKLSILRDKHTASKEFRTLVGEIAMLMCYEATRDLPLKDVEIETPVSGMTTKALAGKKLAFVPILRAGLGMVDGVLTLVPSARVGHIGLYRDPETLQPVEYYCKLPSDIGERDVIVLDPMLATGGSAIDAISQIKKRNPRSIKFMCIIAAPEGLDALSKAHPDVDIFAAAKDEKLNDHGYIVPGLGDAGDRIFGTK